MGCRTVGMRGGGGGGGVLCSRACPCRGNVTIPLFTHTLVSLSSLSAPLFIDPLWGREQPADGALGFAEL